MTKLISIILIILSIIAISGCEKKATKPYVMGESLNNLYEAIKNNKSDINYMSHSNVISVLATYPDLVEVLKRGNIKLPEFDTMIPQGITKIDDYFLITAYDGKRQKTSKCYILDHKGTLINTVDLNTYSHVGSIAYDEINELIWIPGSGGTINAYEKKNVLTQNFIETDYTFDNIGEQFLHYLDKTKKHIAYLCIDENYLYIGNFSTCTKGIVKKFKIAKDENKRITLDYIREFEVPPKVQGITFYTYNDEKYMVLSKSYGRRNLSFIQLYRYNDRISDYTAIEKTIILKMPPLLEQITVFSDELYVIFESSAQKYKDCTDKITNVCVLDLKKILSKW